MGLVDGGERKKTGKAEDRGEEDDEREKRKCRNDELKVKIGVNRNT